MKRGEQGRRDERRRATRNDRGKLIAKRCATVSKAWRERLGDQRCLRPIQIITGTPEMAIAMKIPVGINVSSIAK